MMKAVSFPSASKPISSRRGRPAKRKQRCWSFLVTGINKNGPEMKVPDVVASFRERYTAVKRLTLYPASGPHTENIKTWEGVRATVQFIGPQPSQGPGSLLCQLLAGTSVEAEPIILGRGRKKRPRSECESSEASDYDLEDSRGSTASQLGLARRMAPFYPKPSASIKFPYANIDTTSKHHSGLGLQRAETSLPPPDVSQLISGLYSPPISTRVPPPTAHDCRGMQWDDVLNRVEPPLPNRGLVAPQHSLDLGGLYVSSDSEDELVDALTDSYEGELSSQSIIRELRATAPARRPQELTNKSSGALPLFKRSESFVRGWPIDSGNEVVGNQLHHSAMQFGDGNVVQPVDMVRTSAANQPAFSMNSGLGAPPLVYPNDTTARPVSFERQEKMELLPYSSQSMELSRGVSVQSVQTPQECDFDGMPGPITAATEPILVDAIQTTSRGCRLSFVGLERAGQSLHNLEATAYFRDGTGHEVSSVAGPIQQGPFNRAYANLFYPNMQEIWPDVYGSAGVRTVEVDMCVVIRSADGLFCHIEPGLKVTYRRALVPDEDVI